MLFEPVALMRFKYQCPITCGRWKFAKDDIILVKLFCESCVKAEETLSAYGLKIEDLLYSDNPFREGENLPAINVKAYLDLIEPKEWKGIYTALSVEDGKTIIKSVTQSSATQKINRDQYHTGISNQTITAGTWTVVGDYYQMQQYQQFIWPYNNNPYNN